MKKAIIPILLCLLGFSFSTWGQSPDKMTYQAVIRNAANDLMTN